MNKEVKEICMKCELEFHKRGKGCAFRSLGNEYCDLIEDFNKSITNYQNQVEKLTQENNDLEERVIHQDNLIKQLRGNCKDLGKKNENQREELNGLLKQREKFKTKHYYLKAEKEHLQSVIDKAIKYIETSKSKTSYDNMKTWIEELYLDDYRCKELLEILRSKE